MNIGIVGATGAVGKEIISVMEERMFPVGKLRLYASTQSVGKGKSIYSHIYGPSIPLEAFDFETAKMLDLIFLAANNEFAIEWGEKLAAAGVIVIDNSSAFRYNEAVPLCIPEINIAAAIGKKLIANPNCTTAIALMVLAPIHTRFRIKRIIMSTYQSASGAGQAGMDELINSMIYLCNEDYGIEAKVFPYQLCCNVIPLIDVVLKNSYSKEEMKVVWETRKILNEPDMLISCTAVRVPTLRSHCEAITIETEEPITAKEVTDILSQSNGVKVVDDPRNNLYPMPLSASGKYDVEVGRIRENPVFGNCGLDLFICGDQLLRGSSLNAVLIAEGLYPTI